MFFPERDDTYVTLSLNEKTKRIRDYVCPPDELVDFEREIERDVNSHQWLHKDTLQSSRAVTSDVFTGIKPGFTKLMTSAGAGDLNEVKRRLDAGDEVNATDESGWTALMVAAARIQVSVVKLLLSAGADPSMKDKNGDTALIGAAAGRWFNDGSNEGQAEVIKLLVASGADPNALNSNGSTALMLAAQSGNPDAVRTLLKSSSDPSRENSYGFTALRYAEHARSEPKNEQFQNNFELLPPLDPAHASRGSALFPALEIPSKFLYRGLRAARSAPSQAIPFRETGSTRTRPRVPWRASLAMPALCSSFRTPTHPSAPALRPLRCRSSHSPPSAAGSRQSGSKHSNFPLQVICASNPSEVLTEVHPRGTSRGTSRIKSCATIAVDTATRERIATQFHPPVSRDLLQNSAVSSILKVGTHSAGVDSSLVRVTL